MSSQPAFRLFGFPVHVRPGFYMFMVLVVFVNGPDLGLWLAGFIAVLTLIHELGHAFAARATGRPRRDLPRPAGRLRLVRADPAL